MKKLLLIIALLAVAAGMRAQEMEYLDSMHVSPDPLYHTHGATLWQSHQVVFRLTDQGQLTLTLRNPPHIYVGDYDIFGHYKPYQNARVALYAANDSLLMIADKWQAIPSDHGQRLALTAKATAQRPNGQKMKVEITHLLITLLRRPGSYMRIVANVYGDYYHEVRCTMRPALPAGAQ